MHNNSFIATVVTFLIKIISTLKHPEILLYNEYWKEVLVNRQKKFTVHASNKKFWLRQSHNLIHLDSKKPEHLLCNTC